MENHTHENKHQYLFHTVHKNYLKIDHRFNVRTKLQNLKKKAQEMS